MRWLIVPTLLIACPATAADPYAAAKTIIGTQCGACHRVPGVPGAFGDTGPSLAGIARQPKIANTLPNNQANMARWLMHPQQIMPGTVMPDLGLTQVQARQLAAYLATLDKK